MCLCVYMVQIIGVNWLAAKYSNFLAKALWPLYNFANVHQQYWPSFQSPTATNGSYGQLVCFVRPLHWASIREFKLLAIKSNQVKLFFQFFRFYLPSSADLTGVLLVFRTFCLIEAALHLQRKKTRKWVERPMPLCIDAYTCTYVCGCWYICRAICN